MNTIEILKKINQIESILVNIKEDLNSKGNNNTGLNKLSNKLIEQIYKIYEKKK